MFLLCSIAFKAAAQKNNVFLDKAFWKENPSLETVQQKIKEGNDPTQLTAFGFDAITGALFAKVDNSIIKFLIDIKGNGVDKLTHDGRTYLFWAAYKGNLEIMKYLINNGAKMDVIDDKGYSPLTFTAVVGRKEPGIYDFLIKNGSDVLKEKSKDGANTLLLLIPHLEDFKMVEYFEAKGIDLHSKDKYGNGAFNYTAQTGNIELLKKLIDKGLDYKTLNSEGGNAFIFASKGTRRIKNGLDVYTYLESLGLNPNITTSKGVNPLHSIGYSIKDKEVFNFFISKGVSVEQKNEEGNTPFMNATAYNSLNIVKYLSKQVKDINAKNKKGQTALTKAISSNNVEVISYLLDLNANSKVLDKVGNNLGYYVVNSFQSSEKDKFFKKAELLKKSGVDFTAKQGKGNTLYHVAISKMDKDLIDYLAKLKLDINTRNSEGLTVLHMAAMKAKDVTLLKYLIQLGADKNIKTDFEETVYDLAFENELLKSVDLQFLK